MVQQLCLNCGAYWPCEHCPEADSSKLQPIMPWWKLYKCHDCSGPINPNQALCIDAVVLCPDCYLADREKSYDRDQ